MVHGRKNIHKKMLCTEMRMRKGGGKMREGKTLLVEPPKVLPWGLQLQRKNLLLIAMTPVARSEFTASG